MMYRWGDIEEAPGLLGLEPKTVDWGMMKKLRGGEAGTRAITMGTVAQEGCEEGKGARLGIGVARATPLPPSQGVLGALGGRLAHHRLHGARV